MEKIVQEVLFTDSECDTLINEVSEWTRSLTAHSRDKYSEQDFDFRNSYEGIYTLSDSVKTMLLNKIGKWNISDLLPMGRVQRYQTGEYFRKHADKNKRLFVDRLKTLTIQLSNTCDYEGGAFKIFSGTEVTTVDETRGNVIIFDSQLKHEVEDVTSGTRYSFVSWLTDEHITL